MSRSIRSRTDCSPCDETHDEAHRPPCHPRDRPARARNGRYRGRTGCCCRTANLVARWIAQELARFGPTHKWHLVFPKTVPQIAFRLSSRFHEAIVRFWSPFRSPRLVSVGPVRDSVRVVTIIDLLPITIIDESPGLHTAEVPAASFYLVVIVVPFPVVVSQAHSNPRDPVSIPQLVSQIA